MRFINHRCRSLLDKEFVPASARFVPRAADLPGASSGKQCAVKQGQFASDKWLKQATVQNKGFCAE